MSCTGVEPKPPNDITELRVGKSTMWMLSVCNPTFVNMASFHRVTRKCTWVQTVPLTLDMEGIITCKVLHPRKPYDQVLLYKSNSKLTFKLCSACADTMKEDSLHPLMRSGVKLEHG